MVLLWWCFSGGVVVWWCFCGDRWCGGVFVVVFVWWCLCAGVFVVVFLCLCFCGGGGGGVFEVFLYVFLSRVDFRRITEKLCKEC